MAATDAIAREIAILARARYPLIFLFTQEEDRGIELAERAASATKRRVVRWGSATGFQEGTLESTGTVPGDLEALAALEEPALIVATDLHRFLDRSEVVRRIRDAIPRWTERRQSLVIIAPGSRLPSELEKDAAVIDVPLPSREELDAVLMRVANSERVEIAASVREQAVRSSLGLGRAEAERVFRKVIVSRRGLEERDLALVVEEKRGALRGSEALEFCELSSGLGSVGGLGELKRWLSERTRAFGPEARSFGLPAPKGLLLLGVQGCGKSLSAKAVAELWKFPLLRLDLSAVFGGGVSPEAAIRQATKIAETLAPAVLWIDEIEKGFSQAGDDERSRRVFGSFLTWLSEKTAEVFVVATANDVTGLPPELLRRGRFDEIFFVDLPNAHERLEILKIHLERRGREPARFPELEALARRAEHFSGAELEQVVVAGLYRAFAAERELSAEDLDLALQRTVPLYATYEESIKRLRDWAKRRARPASRDASVLDLFQRD